MGTLQDNKLNQGLYSVTVLISTYNGEKYLREQLSSVLNQEGVKLNVLVRDDGSRDSTISILEEYQGKYENFSFYRNINLGPAKSFLNLIEKAPISDFYALCDQDDVWDPDKLSSAVNMLKKLDSDKPNLYYSNLRIVDQNLIFYRNSHAEPLIASNKFACLTENLCTGCTAVFNLKVKQMIQGNLPEYCSMHDTWIYMLCNLLGNVVYDFTPHISYRQHGGNVVGTYLKQNKFKLYYDKFKRIFKKDLQPRYLNACNFYQCYKGDLDETSKVKILKIVNYKKSFSNKLELLKDSDIIPSTAYGKIRYTVHVFGGTV